MIRDEPLPLSDLSFHRAVSVQGFTWAVWGAYDVIRPLITQASRVLSVSLLHLPLSAGRKAF